MSPRPADDADLDRMLTERLGAEVEDITAGPALLERIKADARTTGSPRAGRPRTRWLLPVAAAAAAVMIAIVFATGGDDGGTDVATGDDDLDEPPTQVLLSGEAGGEEWTVVEYVEDDPFFVDEPTTCLRFEPPIEDGPFFCGTEDDLVGAHGRLVLRRGSRFNDHAVFAGVFAPQVAEVTLEIEGREDLVIEPTPWSGTDLGIAVSMQPVPDDVGYDGVLRDLDDQVLSIGSSGGEDGPAPPTSVVAEPGSAAPGQIVELRFPTEAPRGVAWHVSRYDLDTARWSEPLYLLISDRSSEPDAPSWQPEGEDWAWEDIAVTGPGPDRVVIPDTADAAIYRICPADGEDFATCAAVTVTEG